MNAIRVRGRPAGPLASLGANAGFEQRSPRLRAIGSVKAAVAGALDNDVRAWMSQPRDWSSRCRVTLSDSSIVSVLCSSYAAGAGFSYRLGDGKRIDVKELLARLPRIQHVLARHCVDANMIASPVKNVPDQTESVLQSFALEIDDVCRSAPPRGLCATRALPPRSPRSRHSRPTARLARPRRATRDDGATRLQCHRRQPTRGCSRARPKAFRLTRTGS